MSRKCTNYHCDRLPTQIVESSFPGFPNNADEMGSQPLYALLLDARIRIILSTSEGCCDILNKLKYISWWYMECPVDASALFSPISPELGVRR